jgi:hypothetical protein
VRRYGYRPVCAQISIHVLAALILFLGVSAIAVTPTDIWGPFRRNFSKEVHMLLHLPIAIMATLLPVAVSDTVPKFDVVRECRYEGGSTADIDRCSKDEAAALEQLKNEWARFVGADKRTCMNETTMTGDFASYVELQTCLEMASDARKQVHQVPDSGTGTGSPPPAQPGVTVGVGHDPTRLRNGR